jgi:membrane associated rhomboid family serine protease
MIPLRDSEAIRRFTPVNTLLILANIGVFALELHLGPRAAELGRLAMVPARITRYAAAPENFRLLVPLITSLFLHASLMHIAGNMLYLLIFGPAVEQRMRGVRYLLFYLVAGVAAGLAMVAMGPMSRVPVIGASGAIAGVLGAYFVLYPRAYITTILPIFIFIQVVQIPAVFYLLFWFAAQLYAGLASGAEGPLIGGVAWWAHVGGFLFGIAAAPLLARHASAAPRRAVRY